MDTAGVLCRSFNPEERTFDITARLGEQTKFLKTKRSLTGQVQALKRFKALDQKRSG
jgi:hypothetical protein